MIKAPTPENEAARLSALKNLRILDTPVEERFERITRLVCRSLGVPTAVVSLVDQERQWFKSAQGLEETQTARDISFCGHGIMSDQPMVVENALEDERFHDNPLVTAELGVRFYAGMPLRVKGGERVGMLCAIDSAPRTISDSDLEVLRDLAAMVESELQAEALSEAHGNLIVELQEAERAALIDPLTRTWNRRGGEELLQREWESMQRKRQPMSVAMVDIDHFKKVNDNHGHDVGDAVIKHVAQTLLKSLRPYDVLARWGGEEFLLLFPDCDEAQLESAVQRLVLAIRNAPASTPGGMLAITASIGAVAICPETAAGTVDYLKLADMALYEAKGAGRDRAEIARYQQPAPEAAGF